MKTRLLLITVVLTSFVLHADEFRNKYGNGIIHIQPDSVFKIEFYSAPNSAVTHAIKFTHYAWSTDRTFFHFDTFSTIDSLPIWFESLFFITHGENSRIDLVAIDSSKDFYRTILKDDLGREVWIKKSKHVQFITWFGFYCTMASIQLNSDTVILYSGPTEQSKATDYTNVVHGDNLAQMRPLEVKFFWMKVEIRIPNEDPAKPEKILTGWIKWRDEKAPLIKYNLMGC